MSCHITLLFALAIRCQGYVANTAQQQAQAHVRDLYRTDEVVLRQIINYLTDDELALIHQSISESECLGLNNLYSLDTWQTLYRDHPAVRQMFDSQQSIVRADCGEMELSSEQCFEDCLLYNDVLSWIPQVLGGNDSDILYMIQLYSVSAGPFAYYDAGNPDMCTFNEGTYCYTPAVIATFPLQQHACCLPGACVGEDAHKVLQSNTWCYDIYASIYDNLTIDDSTSVEVLNICSPIPRQLDAFGPLFVIFIFIVFVLFVLIASLIKQYRTEYGVHTHHIDINQSQPQPPPQPTPSLFHRAFNGQGIWRALISVRPTSKSQYNFLDGIRVFSMSWVIFGHSFLFFITGGTSNLSTLIPGDPVKPDFEYTVMKPYMMLAEYAFYSVDSFFFLSGFLAAFSIWRSVDKMGPRKAARSWYAWVPLCYVARFLRIMPMMMFVTAIQWQLQDQLSGGYHVISRTDYTDYCDDAWYQILFFYQNLMLDGDHPEALSCMGHLWYIQCDMQMYLLLPFIMLLFSQRRVYGVIAAALPVLICLIIRLVYAFHYDFVANTLYPGYPPKNGGNQDMDSYYKTWTRMSPYFIGVAAMLIFLWLDETFRGQKKLVLTKAVYFCVLILSCFILASLVWWPLQDVINAPEVRWSLLANQMYYALSKPAWGIGLALLCFALKYKDETQRSLIKRFLSLEVYQVLGKLTYMMYLLHLIVFAWWALDNEMPLYYDEWNELMLVITVWAITAFLALLLWLTMEKPLGTLATAFMKWIATPKRRGGSNAMMDEALMSSDKKASMPTSIGAGRDEEAFEDEQTLKEHSMFEEFDESKSKQMAGTKDRKTAVDTFTA